MDNLTARQTPQSKFWFILLFSCLLQYLIVAVNAQNSGSVEGSGQNKEFKAGAYASNITPPLGEPIVGNWNSPPATYIHDQLHAKTLVLDDGDTRLVFVIADNVGINRQVFDQQNS